MKVKTLFKGVAKIGWFAKIIGTLGQGILKTRPISHPSVPYLYSRAKNFHNQIHRSFGIDRVSFSKEHTSF
jgi:hypothetical protein